MEHDERDASGTFCRVRFSCSKERIFAHILFFYAGMIYFKSNDYRQSVVDDEVQSEDRFKKRKRSFSAKR